MSFTIQKLPSFIEKLNTNKKMDALIKNILDTFFIKKLDSISGK